MKKPILFMCAFFISATALFGQAYSTGIYRNLFRESGYSAEAIAEKLQTVIIDNYFYGDDDIYNGTRLYIENGDEAYIRNTDECEDEGQPCNAEVRSEGQSYGMMVCVMMDMQEEFDKLWKFAYNQMQHHSGEYDGYFSWKVSTSGNMIDQAPAPDGEVYFVTALYMASERWGNKTGIFEYSVQADNILQKAAAKGTTPGGVNNFINAQNLIVFQPCFDNDTWTDPSYHLPGFFEYWAKVKNNTHWHDVAEASRKFFRDATNNPQNSSGLMSDYSNFDGSPADPWSNNSVYYYYDAHRCIMNLAFDYEWFRADDEQAEMANDWLGFFNDKGINNYGQHYNVLTGAQVGTDGKSLSQVACNAVGALASDEDYAEDFVNDLWNANVASGWGRYYGGTLHMLGLLHCSGKFRGSFWDSEGTPATGVRMTAGTYKLTQGHTTDLSYTVLPTKDSDKSVTVVSSNTSIAEVTLGSYGEGTITAISPGTVTITITTASGYTDEIQLEVFNHIDVTSMALHPLVFAIRKGKKIPMEYGVIPYYATNTNVVITVSDPSVVDYNSGSGEFTAVGEGMSNITVYSAEDYSIYKRATVTVLPEGEKEEEELVEYNIVISARGTTGEEHMYIAVGEDDVAHEKASWDVNSTNFTTYTATITGEGDVYVGFDNDDDVNNGRDLIVEYIEISVDGETDHRNAEDGYPNSGSWGDEGCGTGGPSQTINCMGSINFGDIVVPGTGGNYGEYAIKMNARGTNGDEHIDLLIDGVAVGDGWTLSTGYQEYSSSVFGDGIVDVEFTNDGDNRDVQLDYIEINKKVRQTEDMENNTAAYDNGVCGGGSYTEWLHCNGKVGFEYVSGKPMPDIHTITIRARGTEGGEHMDLLIDGYPVNSGWWLTTNFQEYTVEVEGDGDINVEYDNNYGDYRDVVVDWIRVDDQNVRQAENMEYNTGAYANGYCGGGSYTEWLHCNGVIGFGNISSDFKSAPQQQVESSLARIYPNPTSGDVTIKFEGDNINAGIKILDLTGRVIYDDKGITDNEVKVAGLDTGVYFVIMSNNGQNYSSKLVVR